MGGVLVIVIVAVVAYFSLDKPDDQTPVGRRLVKVRLFWVRHGLSCANVMDKCSKGPSQAEELLPKVEHALQLVPGYESNKLNQTFGLQAATPTEGDCTVEVIAP